VKSPHSAGVGNIARASQSNYPSSRVNLMSPLLALSNSLADTVAAAGMAIVAINTGQRMSPSGIHWRKGIIITSDEALHSHEDLAIVNGSGQSMPINLLGRDPTTDIAVFTLAGAETLPVATISNSSSLQVGHLVLALARSTEGDLRSTMGTVSILTSQWQSMSGGTIDRFIRPDLSFYRGFAGGALVDAAGNVVGMNTTGKRGTALTIPAETVDRVIDQLLSKGRIARGYLGVGMQAVPLSPQLSADLNLMMPTGVILIKIEPKSPAEAGGLFLGDILVSWDGTPIADPGNVRAFLNRGDYVGRQVKLGAIRGGVLIELSIEIGERLE
jgi:S1-C subfamily serine protease